MSRVTGYGFQVAGYWLLRKIQLSVFFLTFSFFFLLGHPLISQVLFTDLEDSIHSNQWINLKILDSVQAHSGSHYSIADPDFPFGLGIESQFPEAVQGKNTRMHVEGWVKSNVANDHALFVITLQNNEATVFWIAISLKELLAEKEKWTFFSAKITVPGLVTRRGIVKAYLWNDDNQDTIAIDDLGFEFEILSNKSYIPELGFLDFPSGTVAKNLLFKNDFYSLFYDKEHKIISVYSASEKLLIRNIGFYDEYTSGNDSVVENEQFTLNSAKTNSKGKKLQFVIDRVGSHLKMELVCSNISPEIKVRVEEEYELEQLVSRKSVVFQSGQKISKVYRANRKIDTADFQTEYWLGKQGANFGKGDDSWFVYHAPSISSLQLNSMKDRLWVNLDFEKDHPFLHFPLMKDTLDLMEDISASFYKNGEKHISQFSIYAGSEKQDLPRFMKNPSGYLAAYIWTEHADFTDIKTNRAAFFGAEDITDADSAIGGFVKYKVPVTKSVFYFNPDQITNEEISGGRFTDFVSTILGDALFSDFLQQLNNHGHEICLHTPEQFSTTKKNMKKSLKYMSKHFSSPSWIDHGYNNGSKNNREDFVCDGLNIESESYSLKRWKKSGIDYFWNPYYEDYLTFDTLQFGEMIAKPYRGFGDHIPNPDYWQHPTRTAELWHWPTKSVLYVERDELWVFYFNEAVLNDFINGWCVEFNHCYPAWVDPAKGFWDYNSEGKIVAREGFNKTLEKMAKLRDEGLLNLTTVKTYMDYRLAVEKVDYTVLTDGSVKVTNTGKGTISGLSFAIQSNNVLVNDRKPEQKIVGSELIFWFDLGAGESKFIRVVE